MIAEKDHQREIRWSQKKTRSRRKNQQEKEKVEKLF